MSDFRFSNFRFENDDWRIVVWATGKDWFVAVTRRLFLYSIRQWFHPEISIWDLRSEIWWVCVIKISRISCSLKKSCSMRYWISATGFIKEISHREHRVHRDLVLSFSVISVTSVAKSCFSVACKCHRTVFANFCVAHPWAITRFSRMNRHSLFQRCSLPPCRRSFGETAFQAFGCGGRLNQSTRLIVDWLGRNAADCERSR